MNIHFLADNDLALNSPCELNLQQNYSCLQNVMAGKLNN
jgi:hypothetical protein